MIEHDPVKQVNYIQQVLCQNKKPVGFLLSAGCSLSIKDKNDKPLIPDIKGLTEIVIERINKEEADKKCLDLVLGHFKKDGKEGVNIEDILSHIRALRQVAGKEKVRDLKFEELDKLDTRICNSIVEIMKKEFINENTPYHKLSSWVGSILRDNSIEIFTTNYDLLIEQALESRRVPYFDGFIGAYNAFFDVHAIEEDMLPVRWARLWKLHGSINWNLKDKGLVIRCQAEEGCRVIHPSHLKYDESRKMPYLAMIDRLRSFLKKPSAVLMICGYSFRDEHINTNIMECLQRNPGAIVFALTYGEIKNYPVAIKIAKSIPNFSLLAEDEAVIGMKQAAWIEKENAGEKIENGAVDWTEKKRGEKEISSQARFKLGDFMRFGTFLEDIIGVELKDKEPSNAE